MNNSIESFGISIKKCIIVPYLFNAEPFKIDEGQLLSILHPNSTAETDKRLIRLFNLKTHLESEHLFECPWNAILPVPQIWSVLITAKSNKSRMDVLYNEMFFLQLKVYENIPIQLIANNSESVATVACPLVFMGAVRQMGPGKYFGIQIPDPYRADYKMTQPFIFEYIKPQFLPAVILPGDKLLEPLRMATNTNYTIDSINFNRLLGPQKIQNTQLNNNTTPEVPEEKLIDIDYLPPNANQNLSQRFQQLQTEGHKAPPTNNYLEECEKKDIEKLLNELPDLEQEIINHKSLHSSYSKPTMAHTIEFEKIPNAPSNMNVVNRQMHNIDYDTRQNNLSEIGKSKVPHVIQFEKITAVSKLNAMPYTNTYGNSKVQHKIAFEKVTSKNEFKAFDNSALPNTDYKKFLDDAFSKDEHKSNHLLRDSSRNNNMTTNSMGNISYKEPVPLSENKPGATKKNETSTKVNNDKPTQPVQQNSIKSVIRPVSFAAGSNKNEILTNCLTPNCIGMWISDNLNESFLYKCPVCSIYNCVRCQTIHTGKTCKESKSTETVKPQAVWKEPAPALKAPLCFKNSETRQTDEIFYCKTAKCTGMWIVDIHSGYNLFQCPLCKVFNCSTCNVTHEGQTCNEFKKKKEERNNPVNQAPINFVKKENPVETKDAWMCPVCTIINNNKDEKCIICNIKRPARKKKGIFGFLGF